MKIVRRGPVAAPPKLTEEEGFVLARIEGELSVRDLVALTGIEQPRMEQIVSSLASRGAVVQLEGESSGYLPSDTGSNPALGSSPEVGGASARGGRRIAPPPDEGTTSLADFAAALGMDPSAFAAEAPAAAIEEKIPRERIESKSSYPPPATTSDLPDAPSENMPIAGVPAGHPLDELIEVKDEDEPAFGELEEIIDDEAAAAEDGEDGPAESAEEAEANAVAEANYRQLYQTKFHPLPVDARVAAAKTASGAELLALCFDVDPRVIAAILENPTQGLQHVRMIAQYHRTGTGLEIMTRRVEYLRDLLVERRLLKNPQAGDTVLGRIMKPKRVFQTYKVAIDREIPELTRVKARGFLRKKFQSSPPEDRADLVIRTEGRCLILLTGCTFDAKSTQILCGRPYNSVLFIQNLAKFAATPPALLAHLVKQPFVRKIHPLKKLLLQHPNMPGEAKRNA